MFQKISIKSSLQKAFFTVLLSAFVYYLYHIEFIRSHVEDFAFDIVNELVMFNVEEKIESPNVLLFKIDTKYLQDQKLIDENNETLYGYFFPRDKIAAFIDSIDNFLVHNPASCPKAIFIDFDLSYSSDLDGHSLTSQDVQLIDTLKKERCYTVLLPKLQNKNFIEFSSDAIIKEKINRKKIMFVSTGLTEAGDKISRRYYPYEKYKEKNLQDKYYLNGPITMWSSYKGINPESLKNYFNTGRISLIENRIIFKNKHFFENDDKFEALQSDWKNLTIYSANYPLNNIPVEKVKDAFVFLGSVHAGSNDSFVMDSFDTEISGVEMHANALMTLFYLNGKLNRLTIFETSLLVFIIVFGIDILVQIIGNKIYFVKDYAYPIIIISSIILMFSISVFLVLVYKVWFNWAIMSLLTPFATSLVILNKFFAGFVSIKNSLMYIITSKFLFKIFKKIQ